MKFDIKLQEAKKAIALSDFKRDDLLIIALTEPSDLDCPEISKAERERLENIYRRLAFLGDSLLDSVLADYFFHLNQGLSKEELNDCRQDLASKKSLTKFAIELGLPQFSSSWNRKNRKPPEEEPRLWAEMFEAVIGVIFIDRDRDFLKLSEWLVYKFIYDSFRAEIHDPGFGIVTTAEYLDMIGLEGTLGSLWAPGDDDY